jgi:hypothetical protein
VDRRATRKQLLKPAPAFLCYASNIIADKRYRLMSLNERFVWISIYLECWPNRAVPADPDDLAKYLGYQVEEIKAGLTARVLSFFEEVRGELICPELDEYRETQRLRNLKKSEGGKKGAERKRIKAISKSGDVEVIPTGTPKGPLIQSKPNQSNQTQSIKKEVEPIDDPWVKEYEAAETLEENPFNFLNKT